MMLQNTNSLNRHKINCLLVIRKIAAFKNHQKFKNFSKFQEVSLLFKENPVDWLKKE